MDTIRPQVTEQSRDSGLTVRVLLVVIALTLFVGISIIAYNRSSTSANTSENKNTVRAVTASDHILGNLDAPIQLIVYTDLECPYCKQFHQVVQPALQEEYGDSLVIVFRHFPLPSRPKGLVEAEAAECAYLLGGENAFWAFVNNVFAVTPSNNGLDLALLPDIAERVGLDTKRFQECRDEGGGSNRVRNDKIDGVVAGVTLVPSIRIQSEGRSTLIAGVYPERIRAAIEYVRADSAIAR